MSEWIGFEDYIAPQNNLMSRKRAAFFVTKKMVIRGELPAKDHQNFLFGLYDDIRREIEDKD